MKKSFQIWVRRWQRQVELAQFEDLISYKGNVAVARRAFVHWKYCILTLLFIYLMLAVQKDMLLGCRGGSDLCSNHA